MLSPRRSCGTCTVKQNEKVRGVPWRGSGEGAALCLWSGDKDPPAVSVQSLSRVRLCDPMDCSTPGLPVHHQLAEFTQAHAIESVMPSSHLKLCCVPKKKKKEAHKLENNTKLRQCEERSS